MKKQRFGIDIDGTITDPATFIPYINKHFNKSLTIDDITEYDLSSVLGISAENFWKWMKVHEPTIYKKAVLATGARQVLKEWKELHELFYISARAKVHHDITLEWFHQLAIPYDHLELLGKHDKLAAVKKHKLDIFFEDKHDNACDIAEECAIPVILMNTPYNQGLVPKGVIRVNNWTEAKEIINQFYN
ncbi:putative HAD superfamily protein [Evansella vedderi]|uniref:Nucleotidase n=1 Tax=Evansella vedderi TaxID=38282 RepID=A0ABT9ZT63_9BACI|nr:hypothetical protein [Evansella vedderi]MDQ0254389.1 putative HAD superfamily protein [Evansella vedderi]